MSQTPKDVILPELATIVPNRKRHRRKKWTHQLNCAVCNIPCKYAFYGVHCCERNGLLDAIGRSLDNGCHKMEQKISYKMSLSPSELVHYEKSMAKIGCKQFFRRTIIQQSQWDCNGKCGKENQQIDFYYCKSCRFDKCLLVGMRWNTIGVVKDPNGKGNEFLEKLHRKRNQLLVTHQNTLSNERHMIDEQIMDAKMQENFSRIEKLQRRIFEAYFSVPDNFAQLLLNMEVCLRPESNIFTHSHHFPIEPLPYNFWAEPIEPGFDDPFGHERNFKRIVIDRLLGIGMAMTMPIFQKLSLQDRLSMVNQLQRPNAYLINSFYAVQNGFSSWQHLDGYECNVTINALIPNFRNDKTLTSLFERIHIQSLHSFQRMSPMTTEEFMILLAILHSNSAIRNISTCARELLYSESVRYSKMLLKLQQSRLGPVAGAQRYSECILIVENCFHGAQQMEMFETYLETFYVGRQKGMIAEAKKEEDFMFKSFIM